MQNTRQRHHPRTRLGEVLYSHPHEQSLAALAKLTYEYWSLDTTVYKMHRWQQFRWRVLSKILKDKGDLVCHWCGRKHLLLDGGESTSRAKKDVATLDHVTPCKDGGGLYDESNVVPACQSCNNKRNPRKNKPLTL
jgi:hypothetical protein